jgi:FkbM family methyltransferase
MIKKLIKNSIEWVSPELMFKISLWRKGKYEREVDILKYLIQPSRMAIDIGANIGYYTYHMLKYTDKIMVFEPNPLPAAKLRRLFGTKARIEQVALSDKSDKITMYIPMRAGQMIHMLGSVDLNNPVRNDNDAHALEVAARRLDDYQLENVGFIKIDVEGHELAVLKGAYELLTRDRPSLLIEAEERHRPGAVKSICELLTKLDYRGFFIIKDEIRPMIDFDPGVYQNPANDSAEAKAEGKNYINNFIFISRQEILAAIPHDLRS